MEENAGNTAPITLETILNQAPSWTFAGDFQLLEWMSQISKNLDVRATTTTENLNRLNNNIKSANVNLDNVANSLTALQYGNQFVECRVQDDDETLLASGPEETAITTESPKHTSKELLSTFLDNNLKLLHDCYEKYSLDVDDSDEEDDKREKTYIYQTINPFNERPLPYIFGSKEWHDKWHVGLADDQQDNCYSGDDISEVFSESSSSASADNDSYETNSECPSSISTGNVNFGAHVEVRSASSFQHIANIEPASESSSTHSSTAKIKSFNPTQGSALPDLYSRPDSMGSSNSNTDSSHIKPANSKSVSAAKPSRFAHNVPPYIDLFAEPPEDLGSTSSTPSLASHISRKPINLFDDDDEEELPYAVNERSDTSEKLKTTDTRKDIPTKQNVENAKSDSEAFSEKSNDRRFDASTISNYTSNDESHKGSSSSTNVSKSSSQENTLEKKQDTTAANYSKITTSIHNEILFKSSSLQKPTLNDSPRKPKEASAVSLAKTTTNLFDDDDDDDDFLSAFVAKQKMANVSKTSTTSTKENIFNEPSLNEKHVFKDVAETSNRNKSLNLFDDIENTRQTMNNTPSESPKSKEKVNKDDAKQMSGKTISNTMKSTNLFDDDEEDEDDMFRAKPSIATILQKPEYKKNENEQINDTAKQKVSEKPTDITKKSSVDTLFKQEPTLKSADKINDNNDDLLKTKPLISNAKVQHTFQAPTLKQTKNIFDEKSDDEDWLQSSSTVSSDSPKNVKDNGEQNDILFKQDEGLAKQNVSQEPTLKSADKIKDNNDDLLQTKPLISNAKVQHTLQASTLKQTKNIFDEKSDDEDWLQTKSTISSDSPKTVKDSGKQDGGLMKQNEPLTTKLNEPLKTKPLIPNVKVQHTFQAPKLKQTKNIFDEKSDDEDWLQTKSTISSDSPKKDAVKDNGDKLKKVSNAFTPNTAEIKNVKDNLLTVSINSEDSKPSKSTSAEKSQSESFQTKTLSETEAAPSVTTAVDVMANDINEKIVTSSNLPAKNEDESDKDIVKKLTIANKEITSKQTEQIQTIPSESKHSQNEERTQDAQADEQKIRSETNAAFEKDVALDIPHIPNEDKQLSKPQSLTNMDLPKSYDFNSSLLFDEPPDDNDFLETFTKASQSTIINSFDLENDLYPEPDLPQMPTPEQFNEYKGLQIFSDIPPDDNDLDDYKPEKTEYTKRLNTVFYDDCNETKLAISGNQEQINSAHTIFNLEPPALAEQSDNDALHLNRATMAPTPQGNKIDNEIISSKDVTPARPISKLKLPNININVQALLPGKVGKPMSFASAQSNKEVPEKVVPTKQTAVPYENLHKHENRIQSSETNHILLSINKNRVRAPVNRRPSSRRARQENYAKSLLEEQMLAYDDDDEKQDTKVLSNIPSSIENNKEISKISPSAFGFGDNNNVISKKSSAAKEETKKSLVITKPGIGMTATSDTTKDIDPKDQMYATTTSAVKVKIPTPPGHVTSSNLLTKKNNIVQPDVKSQKSSQISTTISKEPKEILGANRSSKTFHPFFDEDEDDEAENDFLQSITTNKAKNIEIPKTLPPLRKEISNQPIFATSKSLHKEKPSTSNVSKQNILPTRANLEETKTSVSSSKNVLKSNEVMKSNTKMFDTDDEDDDLFAKLEHTTKPTAVNTKTVIAATKTSLETTKTTTIKPQTSLFGDDSDDQDDDFLRSPVNKVLPKTKLKVTTQDKSIFSDTDSDDGDLFVANRKASKQLTSKAPPAICPENTAVSKQPNKQTVADNPLADLL